MTKAELTRLAEIEERISNPGAAVHTLPATAWDMRFLLDVIVRKDAEIARLKAKAKKACGPSLGGKRDGV